MSEFERYVSILGLADPQRNFLKIQYSQYCMKCLSLWTKATPKIEHLGEDAGSVLLTGQSVDETTVELFAAFLKEQESLSSAIKSEDDTLFNSLEMVLSEAQLQLVQRLRMNRQRATTHVMERCITVARVDLSKLVDESGLGPDARVAIEPVMLEYEAVVTPLMVRFDQGLGARMAKRLQIIRERQLHQASQDAVAALDDEHEQLFRPAAEIERRIAKVNHDFFPRFLDALPPVARDGFTRMFQHHAYYLIYPDATYPDDLRPASLLVCNTAESRAAMTGIWESFDQKYQAISKTMEAEIDDWGYKNSITRQTLAFPEFRERIRKIRDDRMGLDRQLLVDLFQVLSGISGEDAAAFNEQIRLRIEDVQAKRELAKTDEYPPWSN